MSNVSSEFDAFMRYPAPYLLMKAKEYGIDTKGMSKKQIVNAIVDLRKKGHKKIINKLRKEVKGLK